MMTNVAQDVLWPTNSNILIRVGMLYVGQGDSSVVLVKDGHGYKTVLIDINRDNEGNNGINVPKLMKDLLADQNGRLDLFVNTHPHNDHLDDITELSKAVEIHEIWESGHVPGKDDKASYDELQAVIKKVKGKHGDGAVTEMIASRTPISFGDAQIYVLSPAEHVKDDIADEDDAGRRRRIHEHCAVLRIGNESTWILFTGDADRTAWEVHITNYHMKRLPSQILNASHHGSRTFFKDNEDDEPYMKALETIDPVYVIISAPKQSESRHGHPHDDAMELYEDHVGKDNVLHTGANSESYICDIFTDGTYEIRPDTSLVDEYGRANEDSEDDKKTESKGNARISVRAAAPTVATKLDRRPMGSQ